MNDHDGKCPVCGAVVPCLEADCDENPGHEYLCDDCLQRELDRPDPFDLACERRYD